MPYIVADRVFETSTSTGTGSFNLAGSTAGFRTFVAGVGTGNTCNYEINNGTDWEIGIGTITAGSPDVLARDTVTSSSNAGAKVNWGSGTKNVFLPLIASNTVITAKENIFTSNQKIDSLQTNGASGITLKNSAGTTVLTVGATAGLASTFAGSLTVSGKTTTAASVTGNSGLTIPHGVTPTSPVNGDIWTSTAGIFVHINGVTQTLQGSLNRNYVEYSANTDLTTSIPYDDTIPQVTEGTQILSATITPKTTTNRVRARIIIAGAQSATANTYMGVALFRNGASDAIAAKAVHLVANSQGSHEAVLEFEHVPASTSLQTYTVRVGLNVGTLRLNGTASGRIYGGVQVCTMILEEIPV